MKRLFAIGFFLGGMLIAIVSCNESTDNNISDNSVQIDSIVIKSGIGLDLSVKDTICVDVMFYPTTVKLDEIISNGNRLFLKKYNEIDNLEPVEFKIVKLEKLETKDNKGYRLFISDTDAGHGYRDTVNICYENANAIVKSAPFEIKNAGTSFWSFSLSDGMKVWDSFAVKNDTILVQVPNSLDLKTATASFKHNGIGVYLNGERQQSGIGTHDYTDFCNPLEYEVKGFDGDLQKYVIEIFNLPIVFINTPDSVEITSRYEWLGNSNFIIRDTDGTEEDYGEAKVKGRGNWTWRRGVETGKKPYAIKLTNKPKDRTVLGMPGHKRWVLLANPRSYLPNPVGFEVNRRAETCKWAPRSRFVELILNGEYQGLYLLCEQIKIDRNRINIKELKNADVAGDALTGGYLLSYDDAEEEDDPIYMTKYFNLPLLIKNPDTDDIQPKQLSYISNFINEAELSLYDEEKFRNKDFYNYFDIDSWIDYFFVAELWGALEMIRPRSVWFYKDRGGKLTAGPLWDYESNFFNKQELYCDKALYYGQLLQCEEVISRMKNKWQQFRSNIIGNDTYGGIVESIDSLYEVCRYSAYRDRKRVPASTVNIYPSNTIDEEYSVIHDNILQKLNWLESQILSW